MSIIDQIISPAIFELIGARIAAILADEISNQITLLEAEIATNPPNKSELELSLASLPADGIYYERSIRPQASEMPVINVIMVNSPLNERNSISQQRTNTTYAIEIYSAAKNSVSDAGDTLSAIKLQRAAGICRAILMDEGYARLGFEPGLIGRRTAGNFQIGQPDEGANDARHSIYGRFNIEVLHQEITPDTDPLAAVTGYDTTVSLKATDKGYLWTINN